MITRVQFSVQYSNGKLKQCDDDILFDSLDNIYRVANGVTLIINVIAVPAKDFNLAGSVSIKLSGRLPYHYYATNSKLHLSGTFYDLCAGLPLVLSPLVLFGFTSTFPEVYVSGNRDTDLYSF